VLHVLATLAVWLACARLLALPWHALVAAALFAVHPVHAEAIGGIVSQADVASAALGALSLAIGVGSALVFGAALLLRAWAEPDRRAPWLAYAPLALVCIAVVALQLSFERVPGGVMPESLARSLYAGMRQLYSMS
jgi:hypothetical protein